MKLLLITILAVLVLGLAAMAEIPQTVNYQGRILDSNGDPVDVSKLMNFIIWKDATSTASGDKVWESGFQTVDIADGLFSVQLGGSPMPPLPDDLFLNDTNLYLGVTVDTDDEISPRTRLSSMGAAYQSLRSDSSAFAYAVSDNSVTSASIVDGQVDGVDLAPDAVTAGHIADGTIGASDIDNTEVQERVTGSCPAGQSIRSINADGSVVCEVDDGTTYTAGTGLQLLGSQFSIAAGGVTGGTGGLIADNSITSADIASNAVNSSELASNSVTTTHIASNTITSSDIASSAVTSTEILDLTITNSDISNSAGINVSKIENESGVAQNVMGANYPVSAPVQTFASRTITCPSPGYVLAVGSATGIMTHIYPTASQMVFGVSDNGAFDSDQNKVWETPNSAPSGSYYNILSAQKIFPVSAGPHTFNILAGRISGSGSILITDLTLSLVFIPTAYGTVTQ